MSREPSPHARFAALSAAGERGALVTVVAGARPGVALGAHALLTPDGGPLGTLGDAALERAAFARARELMWRERSELIELGDVRAFVDVVAPPPRVLVFGGVDVAGPLCQLLVELGWRPYLIEPRERFATRERAPAALEIVRRWPSEAIAELGGIDRATYLVVLSHDPKIDDAAIRAGLASEAAFVGAMGSRRASADRRERLRAAGVPDEAIARVVSPVGLNLGAVSPAETALSIVAELVAVRYGRDGGRLIARRGEIHGRAPDVRD